MAGSMSAFSTARAAAIAILRGVQDLRQCGPAVAARHAVKAGAMMPTAQDTAGRVADALRGRYSNREPLGRIGPERLRRAITDVFVASDAPATTQRVDFDGQPVPVTWRLNDRNQRCGSTNTRLTSSSAPGVAAAFIGRQASAGPVEAAPAKSTPVVVQLDPAASPDLELRIFDSNKGSVEQ